MEPETSETTVDAGSETSGVQAADTSVPAQADTTETTATDTTATETTDAGVDAGGAPSETTVKAGDSCVCPDGRTGTVHGYDQGLICIPNADQG
jgi:hypothetical protein